MKKFFGFFVLCLLVGDVWGMREKRDEPDGELSDESAIEFKKREKNSTDIVYECVNTLIHNKKLSIEQQKSLARHGAIARAQWKTFPLAKQKILMYEFWNILEGLAPDEANPYAQLKRLLDCGVDPDEPLFYEAPLHQAMLMGDKFVALLLVYGAAPNLATEIGAPILWAHEANVMQLLVRAGANINTICDTNSRETVLFKLCVCGWSDLLSVVRALSYGADPALGQDEHGLRAVHRVLHARDLKKLVALLHYGVNFDVATKTGKKPLALARELMSEDHVDHTERAQHAAAQYELLLAISQNKSVDLFDDNPAKFEAAGISRESAVLISAAINDVNEARGVCAEHDFAYDHSGESVTTVVLGRELGRSHKK